MIEQKYIEEPTKKAWSIAVVIGRLSLWFKVVVQGKKQIKGYTYRKIGNLPIVGNNHFKGYEIINPNTNKVLYRKVKDWGVIGNNICDYSPEIYHTASKFFPKNAL